MITQRPPQPGGSAEIGLGVGHDAGVMTNAVGAQERRQTIGRQQQVVGRATVQIEVPVQVNRTGNVAAQVTLPARVITPPAHVDDAQIRIVQVSDQPVGLDQGLRGKIHMN